VLPSRERRDLALLERHPEVRVSYSISDDRARPVRRLRPTPRIVPPPLRHRPHGASRRDVASSLSALYSKQEFRDQVTNHVRRLNELFGDAEKVFGTPNSSTAMRSPATWRRWVSGILAGVADHVLDWRSPASSTVRKGARRRPCSSKHYRLSDDIAFRFSNRIWPGGRSPRRSSAAGWTP
jgi:hypothetical protein